MGQSPGAGSSPQERQPVAAPAQATLEQSARDAKAFLRARAIATAVDLLRLILAYCLGDRGLRSTAAWATAIGLANLSNVALLQRALVGFLTDSRR